MDLKMVLADSVVCACTTLFLHSFPTFMALDPLKFGAFQWSHCQQKIGTFLPQCTGNGIRSPKRQLVQENFAKCGTGFAYALKMILILLIFLKYEFSYPHAVSDSDVRHLARSILEWRGFKYMYVQLKGLLSFKGRS